MVLWPDDSDSFDLYLSKHKKQFAVKVCCHQLDQHAENKGTHVAFLLES